MYLSGGDTLVRKQQRKGIVVCGQSNARDEGKVSDLTSAQAFLANAYANVLLSVQYDGNTDPPVWLKYTRQPLGSLADNSVQQFGVELTLGRDLDSAQAGAFSILKFSCSGTNLVNQWSPTGSYPANDGLNENLFTQWVNFVKVQCAALDAHLAAIIWIQGEADAGQSSSASAYGTNLEALVNAMRANLPTVPVIVGRLNSDYVNSGTGAFTSSVQSGQDAAVAALTNCYELNTDSYPPGSDHTHYEANSLLLLGHAYAGLVANALGIKIPPQASFTETLSALSATFTDTSIAPGSSIASWSWHFGDGGTSTVQSPTHSYSAAGTYTASLTVTAANGLTNTYSTSITISSVAWTVDPTANLAFPSTAAEWTAFISANTLTNWSNPTSLNLCQDTTSPLADVIGSISLPLVGAGALYDQTVPGFARKAAMLTDGTSGGFKSTSASLPDISATSSLLLAWIYFPSTAPAANRFVQILGTNASVQWTTAKKIIVGSGANSVTGTATYSGVVEPVIIKVNHTGSVETVYTSQEELTPTFGVVTGKEVNLGSGGLAAGVGYLYSARWDGAAAERSEADVKALLQAFGKTIPWGSAGWTIDATANQAFPASTSEWTAFLTSNSSTLSAWSTPNGRIGLDQDSATPLADVLGNFSLGAVGAGQAYQQVVTGYTRKAATLTDGTSGEYKSTSTSLPDLSATGSAGSALYLVKVAFPAAAPSAQRFVVIMGTNFSVLLETSGKLNVGSGSNTGTGASSVLGKTLYCIMRHDKTNGADVLYTPLEKIVVTPGATTGKVLALGSGGRAASVGYLADYYWTGAAAERSDTDCHAMLAALGETMSW